MFGILLPDHDADPERELQGECSRTAQHPVGSSSLLDGVRSRKDQGRKVDEGDEQYVDKDRNAEMWRVRAYETYRRKTVGRSQGERAHRHDPTNRIGQAVFSPQLLRHGLRSSDEDEHGRQRIPDTPDERQIRHARQKRRLDESKDRYPARSEQQVRQTVFLGDRESPASPWAKDEHDPAKAGEGHPHLRDGLQEVLVHSPTRL